MGTIVAIADWIKRVADDERQRDEAQLTKHETAARKAELIRSQGRRLIDELCAAVTRDVAAFRGEFAGDRAREFVVDTTALDGGFAVRKPAPSETTLTVVPNLDAAVTVCTYRFTIGTGMPPREDRIEVLFTGNDSATLQMKHRATGQVFATADALSEFLLVPVLTGRPR